MREVYVTCKIYKWTAAFDFPLLASNVKLSLQRAAMGLGVLGTEIEHLLATAGQSPFTLRTSFRVPFSEWGCLAEVDITEAFGK